MGGKRSRGASWCRFAAPWLVLLAATPADAAATSATAPLGAPAGVQDGLLLTGTGEVLYDTNVLRTNSTVLLNGAHRDDFRYSPSATASYGRNAGRLSVLANGLVGHDFFQYNRYLDHNRFSGDGMLTYHSGSTCQAIANGSYSSRQGGIRGGGLTGVDPQGNPDDVGKVINNIQDASLYGLNAMCGTPSGRLSLGGGYVHSSLRNGSLTRKFGDSDSATYSGNLGIGILRPGQLGVTGSYSTINYPNRRDLPGFVIPPQFLNSGVRTYRVGLTLTRPIGTRLSGTVGVSYLHATPTGGQSPYSSPAYNVAVTYLSGPRLSFALVGSRDVIASTTAGALFRVVDQAALTGRYSLGEAISIDANVGLIRNNYKQSFAILGEPPRRNEATTTAGISVTYAPRSLYDLTLSASHAKRTSDPNVFDYNSTKASLTLAVHI